MWKNGKTLGMARWTLKHVREGTSPEWSDRAEDLLELILTGETSNLLKCPRYRNKAWQEVRKEAKRLFNTLPVEERAKWGFQDGYPV